MANNALDELKKRYPLKGDKSGGQNKPAGSTTSSALEELKKKYPVSGSKTDTTAPARQVDNRAREESREEERSKTSGFEVDLDSAAKVKQQQFNQASQELNRLNRSGGAKDLAKQEELKDQKATLQTQMEDLADTKLQAEYQKIYGENAPDPSLSTAGKLAGATTMQGLLGASGGVINAADFITGFPTRLAEDLGVEGAADNAVSRFWQEQREKNQAQQAYWDTQRQKYGMVHGISATKASELGTQVVQNAPQALMAMMSGGTSAAPQLGQKAAGLVPMVQTAITNLSKDPNFWWSFINEVGNSYQEALSQGASNDQATVAALTASLANAMIEVGGETGEGGLQTLLQKIGKGDNAAISWLLSLPAEGWEEVLQGVTSRATNAAFFNNKMPVFGEGGIIDPKAAAEEFGTGMAVAAILGGGQIGANAIYNKVTEESVREQAMQQLFDTLLGEEKQSAAPAQTVTATQEAPAPDRAATQMRMNQVQESAAALGESGSKALAASYDENTAQGLSAEDAYAGFTATYNAKLNSQEMTEQAQQAAAKLPEHMRMAAEAAAENDSIRASQAKYFGEKAGLDRKDAMTKRANLSSKTMRLLDAVGKAAGVQVRFAETVAGGQSNASYQNGVVTIALDTESPVQAVFTHEIVHRIREVSPESYGQLAQFVTSNMHQMKLRYAQASYGARYEAGGDLVTEEIVADAIGFVLSDSKMVNKLVQENRSLAQRIADGIHDFVAAINRVLDGQNVKLTSSQKFTFRELEGQLDEMGRLLGNALKTVEKTGSRAYNVNNETKFSRKESQYGREEAERNGYAAGEAGQDRGRAGQVRGTVQRVYQHRADGLLSARQTEVQPVIAWEPGAIIAPKKGTVALAVKEQVEEYGVPCFVVKNAEWDAYWEEDSDIPPAFSEGGQVYIRETVPERYQGMLAAHELTHVMKQLGYKPYLDFIEATPDHLNMRHSDTQLLLDATASHRGLDMLNLTDDDRLTLYDEFNSSIYGSIAGKHIDDVRDRLGHVFRDFDAYSAELTELHRQFKASRTGAKFSLKIDTEGMSEDGKKVIQELKHSAMYSKYTREGRFVSFTSSRMDREIRKSVYRGDMDAAASHIAWVDPLDFIYATTTSQEMRGHLSDEAGKLDLERLREEDQPIYLHVNMETGEIVGHEGRHRMLALRDAGAEKVAVIIYWSGTDNRNMQPITYKKLTGQTFGGPTRGASFTLHNALPLSERYADAAKQLFSQVEGSVKFSLKDSDYMNAVNAGDMETAQRMVDEAAKAAGYTAKLYHGSPQFGFTRIDVSKSDDGISFFATDSLDVAQTYSGKGAVKQVADDAYDDIEAIEEAFRDKQYDLCEYINRVAGYQSYIGYDAFNKYWDDAASGTESMDVLRDEFYEEVETIIQELFPYSEYYERMNEEDADQDELYEQFAESDEVQRIYSAANDLEFILRAARSDNSGNYQLYANTDNLFELDAKGKSWAQIPFDEYDTNGFHPYVNTRQAAAYAKDKGFAGVKISNVFDDGGRSAKHQRTPATVYIFFNPQQQVKSADPVTYDDAGNVIPLSKRFNTENDDIRYSLKDSKDQALELSDANTRYSLREKAPPKKTIIAYKAFYAHDGKLYPPMVSNLSDETGKVSSKLKKELSGTLAGQETPVGVWLDADVGGIGVDENGNVVRTNDTKRIRVMNDKGGGTLAFRPGWHLGEWPDAKQFNRGPLEPYTNYKGEQAARRMLMPDGLVFAKCEIAADIDYQLDAMEYGMTEKTDKKGKTTRSYARSQTGLPRVPEDGYYKYRTNVDPTTAPWYITGSMRVVEILDDDDCARICARYGVTPDQRESGKKINLADYGLKRGPVTPTENVERFRKGQRNYDNEALLEKALNDPEYADAYRPRELDFDNPEVRKEFEINSQDVDYYRDQYEKRGKQFSLKDSEGRKLSEEQQAFFAHSKVRDAEGNLQVVYHGSRYDLFAEFDTYEGVWLTPERDYAKAYAERWEQMSIEEQASMPMSVAGMESVIYDDKDYRIYKMYANIKNPVFLGELNGEMTGEVVQRLAKALGVELSELKSIADHYMDEAVFMLTRSYEFIELAKRQGFDGFRATEGGRETWCALTAPEQVKLASNTEPTSDPDIRYSLKSMRNDITEGRMFDDLVSAKVFTVKEADLLKKNLDKLVNYMLPTAGILDMNEEYGKENRPYSAYKPNSDPLYVISLDFSTLCRKRLMTQYVIEQLQLRENRPMSAEEQIAIRSMLLDYRQQEKALQVACAMCYVEAARLKAPKQMERFFADTESIMRKYFAKQDKAFNDKVKEAQAKFKRDHGYDENATKKDMSGKDTKALNEMSARMRKEYTPDAKQQAVIDAAVKLPRSTFLTAGNLTALAIDQPDIYAAYTDHIRASTRSKSLESDIPYYYGDSQGQVSDSFIDSVNAENGMRFDSWSDFQMKHMLDMITAVIDLSVRGSKMHGYTKFPEMVRIFGKTGMMFNLSGVTEGNGFDANGNLLFSNTEGIDIVEARKLLRDFPETAGLQCIGVSDDHVRALLRADYVDYVIPYHTSGMNATLRKMAGIHAWKDYTSTQHARKDPKTKKTANADKWQVEPVWSEFYVPEGKNGFDIMRKTAQRYIDMCHERGLIPKFDQFMDEPGYWKLLVDRKMVNQVTGEIVEQKPVKPIFDFDLIKQEIDREVSQYDPQLEKRALKYVVDNFDAVHQRIRDLKKGHPKKPMLKMANEILQAYAEGSSGTKHSKKGGKEIAADIQRLVEQHGQIKAGEKPFREATLPKKTAPRKNVSQTVRTVLEAEATPEIILPDIYELASEGHYSFESITDKQAIQAADAKITDKGWAGALAEWTKTVTAGKVSKENTATGWALYNHAANAGDTKAALEILDNMVLHQRSAAQALQATRILKNLTPEAQLYNVTRSIKNLQEELDKRYGEKHGFKVEINENLAERFLQAQTEETREEVLTEIYRDIGRQMPSRFLDKWNAWRYLAMLGNPRTHVRNIVGNAGFAPVVALKNVTATGIESAVNFVSRGKTGRTKSVVTGATAKDRALLSAAWSDYAKAEELILAGGKYDDLQRQRKEIEAGRVIFKTKPLEAARRFNSAAMEQEDSWFAKPHYAAAMASYCKANGITPEQIAKDGAAVKKAREYAVKEAQKATYRDTNALSQVFSDIGGKWVRSENPAKKAVGHLVEGILPFRKTPANILARGLEYSPVGIIKGVSEAVRSVKSEEITPAQAIDSISAGLTGTGLLALGFWLASMGLVRGHGSDDEKERGFEELSGHQSYSMEIGNDSYTLDWLAPECLPFFVGVNLYDLNKGEEEMNVSTVLNSMTTLTEPMLEMSCLQSLNDLIDSVGYASANDLSSLVTIAASAATSYITQAFPTLLGQIERSGEAERMTTYTDKNNRYLTTDMQYTIGKVSAKIPALWDYQQIPYIDAWGRTESSGKVGTRVVNNMLNPSYTSTIVEGDMEEELLRLYMQTDESVFPSRAAKYFNVDGERKDLTAEEYVKYATLKGQTSYEVVSELLKSKAYKGMNDEKKAKAVEDSYTLANQLAKSKISKYAPDSWVVKAMEAKKTYGISYSTFITVRAELSDLESLKDADGDTITNSLGLLKMEAIYNMKGLTDKQRQALFEYMGVGKNVIHYNPALVKQKLAVMRKKAQ